MGVKIVEYVKPEKVREANEYDETVAAVIAQGEGAAIELSAEDAKAFRREVRKLREAADFAGHKVRSLSPADSEATSGLFGIRPKPVKADAAEDAAPYAE